MQQLFFKANVTDLNFSTPFVIITNHQPENLQCFAANSRRLLYVILGENADFYGSVYNVQPLKIDLSNRRSNTSQIYFFFHLIFIEKHIIFIFAFWADIAYNRASKI